MNRGTAPDRRIALDEPGRAEGRTWWRMAFAALVRSVRAVLWYLDSVLGGQDYQRYVVHRRRTHPGQPIPDERTYWRERYAEAERNPSTRCC